MKNNYHPRSLNQQVAVEQLNRLFEYKYSKADSIAIVDKEGERKTNFSQLVNMINSYAAWLKSLGFKKKDLVFLNLEKSVELIAMRFACSCIGVVYCCVSQFVPESRFDFMQKLLMPKKIISQQDVDSIDIKEHESQIDTTIFDDEPSFVIFTSGSTGQPKAVLHNRSIFSSRLDTENTVTKSKIPLGACVADPSFIVSEAEMMVVLAGGIQHLIPLNRIPDIKWMVNYLKTNSVNCTLCNPDLFDYLSRYYEFDNFVILGGDVVFDKYEDVKTRMFSGYGTSEMLVINLTRLNYKKQGIKDTVEGATISLENTYLDEDGTLFGEVVASGTGLMMGYIGVDVTKNYLDRVEFIKEFQTGDIAKQTKYGIKVIGRKDSIININGKRVGLKEIENELNSINEIKQCCVLAYQKDTSKNKKTLCCLYSADNELDVNFLKTELSKNLFDYMIPNHFIYVSKFPLTLSGKTDKQKVQKMIVDYFSTRNKVGTDQNYFCANDENNNISNKKDHQFLDKKLTLKELCLEISNILNFEDNAVTPDTNLLNLGMDSISALRLLSFLSEKNIDLDFSYIVGCNTPKEILDSIYTDAEKSKTKDQANNNKQNFQIKIKKTNFKLYPVTDTGQIQYEFDRSLGAFAKIFNLFNVSGVLKITNRSLQEIKDALIKLYDLHPILKVKIKEVDGQPHYCIPEDFEYPIDVVVLKSKPKQRTFKKHLRKFDLDKDIISHTTIFVYNNTHYLMFDAHHLAVDGFSMSILVENICRLISKKLPNKELYSAFDIAHAQKNSLSPEENKAIFDYYYDKYKGTKMTELPHKHFGLRHFLPFDNKIDLQIPVEIIDTYCKKHNFSDCKVFFGLFIYALHVATGQTKLAVPTLDSGRVNSGMMNTVGCLFSAYPVICQFDKNKDSFESLVNAVIDAEKNYYIFPFSYSNFKDYYLNNKTTFNYLKNYSQFYKTCKPFDFAPDVEIFPTNYTLFATSPLMFNVQEKNDTYYKLAFSYNTKIYSKKDIKEFVDVFRQCVEEALK